VTCEESHVTCEESHVTCEESHVTGVKCLFIIKSSVPLYTELDKIRTIGEGGPKNIAMPRKAPQTTNLPPVPKLVLPAQAPQTLEGQGVKQVVLGKRPATPPPSSSSSTGRKKLLVATAPARPFIPAYIPVKRPEQFSYHIMQHSANKTRTYLVAMGPDKHRGEDVMKSGCFVYFYPDMFCLDQKSAPCIRLTPAPRNLDVKSAHWWLHAAQLPGPDPTSDGTVQCFPTPKEGFVAGEYVSFRHRPGAYGWISAVIYRNYGNRLYLVCGVMEGGDFRLMMTTDTQVAGPEFTFVPPVDPFWGKSVFPIIHSEEPELFSNFEAPAEGFDVNDPVTVTRVGKKEPVDCKISSVVRNKQGAIVEYYVQFSDGQIVGYPEKDVLGPRVDRFNADLNPAHLTPAPELMQWAKAQDDDGGLGCDEDISDLRVVTVSGTCRLSPVDPAMFVTPPLDLMGPNMIRCINGGVEIPQPGVLINRAAARIRAGAGRLFCMDQD
jgi:hypothetical protein